MDHGSNLVVLKKVASRNTIRMTTWAHTMTSEIMMMML